ncbi:hypothetical protein [Streptomyces fractus]|uniref:AAA family ATPase n=1 Tax=Streptomyces fractus TaxID=641806 RepID=UPI003CF5B298
MLDGGEAPLFVARRLVRFASEDIGIADPHALQQALTAWDVYERLGSPEGELAIPPYRSSTSPRRRRLLPRRHGPRDVPPPPPPATPLRPQTTPDPRKTSHGPKPSSRHS